MGTHIELHIEIKVSGKWLHWNHPRIQSDYVLFTKMSGVLMTDEEEIEPISEPKGFPAETITESTLFHFNYDREDAHSISWLDSHEISEFRKWYDAHRRFKSSSFLMDFGSVLGNSPDLHEFPEDYENTGFEDIRFIFF